MPLRRLSQHCGRGETCPRRAASQRPPGWEESRQEMKPFHYVQSSAVEDATRHVGGEGGRVFFAGGPTLIDLMKIHVLQPSELVDVNRLPLSAIEVSEKSIRIGANVRN